MRRSVVERLICRAIYGRSRGRAQDHDDRVEAARRLLVGITAGHDVFELATDVADLHPKNDTFPGEVYMRIAAEVIAATDDTAAGPIE